jgi:hypothetical protein
MAFNPQARPVARCLTWRDPETGRGQDALRISDLSVTPVPLNHAVFAWLRGGVMGRAGFEPATLGLKVPCSAS